MKTIEEKAHQHAMNDETIIDSCDVSSVINGYIAGANDQKKIDIETACKCVCSNCKDKGGCDGNSPYTCSIIQSIEKVMKDDFSKVSENDTNNDDFAEFTKLFIDRTCDILSNTLPLYFDCATNEPPFWKQIKRDNYIKLVRETLENI